LFRILPSFIAAQASIEAVVLAPSSIGFMGGFEERDLLPAEQKVVGPSPITRSSTVVPVVVSKENRLFLKGAVPKWLRERSAKPRFGGSNPPRASILLNEVKSLEPGPQKLFDYQEKKYY
jgi:hypothetical protein